MTITAKYEGTCEVCGKRILVGAQIEWQKGKKPRHTECAKTATEAAEAGVELIAPEAPAPRPATEKQREYLRSLGASDVAARPTLTSKEASEAIDVAKSQRRPRNWRPCGYPGCSPNFCDECDGEGYRGASRW